eukprot:3339682-Lingulodinium_polyedra.AAC.1
MVRPVLLMVVGHQPLPEPSGDSAVHSSVEDGVGDGYPLVASLPEHGEEPGASNKDVLGLLPQEHGQWVCQQHLHLRALGAQDLQPPPLHQQLDEEPAVSLHFLLAPGGSGSKASCDQF